LPACALTRSLLASITIDAVTRPLLVTIPMAAQASPASGGTGQPHNKSGSTYLSILDESKYSHDRVLLFHRTLLTQVRPHQGLCQASPCKLMEATSGRFTYQQVKVSYGYQLVAYVKYGRETLLRVPTAKLATDLLISHLCGTLNCCEASHLVIEAKAINDEINDERTHCHWSMMNAYKKTGWTGVQQVLGAGICPHQPQCGSTHS